MSDRSPAVGPAPHGIRRGLTDYGDPEFSLFIRGAYARGGGLTAEDLARPIIGIAQTWSEFNPCHRHLREIAEAVKRGVWQAGGLPLEFPTISLGEIYLSPTSMLFRNLMAMDTEEMILGQPMDGVVLLGGCDKTLPAQLMAAASADRPAIVVTAGPMLAGRYEGPPLGDPDPRGVRERRPRADGPRGLHQRRGPPPGDRGPCGRVPRPRRLRSPRADDADGRERAPVGGAPHGGPRRGRRHPRGDEGPGAAPPARGAHRDRRNARGSARRGACPRRLAGRRRSARSPAPRRG